jgi:hypothetical protein
MLAAVVAAASLAVTAWGTYKSAQVADDQLSQSREDSQKERRSQAARLTGWIDTRYLVVANRSLDPVLVTMYLSSEQQRAADPKAVVYLYVGNLPPCTAARIPHALISSSASKRYSGKGWAVQGLHFRTSDGTSWMRVPTGELTEAVPVPWEKIKDRGLGLIFDKQSKQSELTGCKSP